VTQSEWRDPVMKGSSYSCGLEAALGGSGGTWKRMLLGQLHPQPRRFGALKRQVPGISEKMLIQRLREMEADGIVHRHVDPEIPLKVNYALTPLGASLNQAVSSLRACRRFRMRAPEAAGRIRSARKWRPSSRGCYRHAPASHGRRARPAAWGC
jgi:DNA-binding HxlR family transcriptional regulator